MSWFRAMVLVIAVSISHNAACPYIIAADRVNIADLAGRTVDVELAKRYYSNVVVDEVTETKGVITGLAIRGDNLSQKISASQIVEIYIDGEPLDVVYEKDTKSLRHSPDERTSRLDYEKRISAQLKKQSKKLWPRLSPAEMEKACEDNRVHLREVHEKFPQFSLKVYETRYYQVSSDLPASDIEKLLPALDGLYDSLCDGFGIPQGKNIWRGKCVVHAFRERAGYSAFEAAYYQDDGAGSDGRAHSNFGTGRVIVNSYRLSKLENFVGLLTHETTHGFLHRYRSNVHIPHWLNEGISDWTTTVLVPQFEAPRKKQLQAIDYVRKNRAVPEEFFGKTDFSGWKYGLASNLAIYLSKQGSKKYRDFVDGIKEGVPWQEALQEHYGWTTADLVAHYGKSVGVPQLKIGSAAVSP